MVIFTIQGHLEVKTKMLAVAYIEFLTFDRIAQNLV